MSRENVELVRRGIEAYNRGDLDAREFIDSDLEYVNRLTQSSLVPVTDAGL